jgi:membrane fusion protein, multidrug efflux system
MSCSRFCFLPARHVRLSSLLSLVCALGIGLGIGVGAVGCSKKSGASEAPPVAVEVEQLRKGDVTRPLVLFGQTEPLADAVLSFQLAGVVEKVLVKEGQYVTAGALLAVLDKESVKLNVDLSRARLAQASVTYRKYRKGFRKETVQQYYSAYKRAQALYVKAKSDYDSGLGLQKSGTISKTQQLGYKTNHDSAKAGLNQAKHAYQMYLKGYQKEDVQAAGVQASQASTQLKMAKKQLKDAELRAPFAGVIAKKHIEMGELVTAQRQAFELMDLRKLDIKIGVPERIVQSVQVGQLAYVALGTGHKAGSRQMIVGKITRKGVAVDRTTMTYPVSIRIANPVVGGTINRPVYKMLPGKVVRVILFSADRKVGMTLPLSAVLHDGKQPFVYVNDKGRANKQVVTPGKTYRNRIVVEGLAAGLSVVVKGQHQLSPGRKLFVVRSVTPAGLAGPLQKQLRKVLKREAPKREAPNREAPKNKALKK